MGYIIGIAIGITWGLVNCALFKYAFTKPIHQESEETPPKPKLKPSKPIKETEEQRRYKTILDNIDNYDGTGKGQTKI